MKLKISAVMILFTLTAMSIESYYLEELRFELGDFSLEHNEHSTLKVVLSETNNVYAATLESSASKHIIIYTKGSKGYKTLAGQRLNTRNFANEDISSLRFFDSIRGSRAAESFPFMIEYLATDSREGASLKRCIRFVVHMGSARKTYDTFEIKDEEGKNIGISGPSSEIAKVSSQEKAKKLRAKAKSLLEKGKYKEAKKLYAEALTMDMNNHRSHMGLAQSCIKLRDYNSAEHFLLNALSCSPTNPDIYKELVTLYDLSGELMKETAAKAKYNALK